MEDLLDDTLPHDAEDADEPQPIIEQEQDEQVASEADDARVDDPTGPMPVATLPMPAPVEAPRASVVRPSVDAPRLRDVGTTLVGWLRGRVAAIASLFAAHRWAAGVAALVCIGIVSAGVFWGIRATQTPSDEQVQADARERLAPPTHTPSDFETDNPLVLQSVEVTHKRASDTRRDACDVDVEAVFASSTMESAADACLTYVREGDDWKCVTATVGKASHRALAGVNQAQVKERIGTLLEAADSSSDASTSEESLVTLYRDAAVEVTDESFDADRQTDTLSIHCASQGTFVSYECDLSARFRFVAASGAWELAEVSASDDARELSFAPLVGTWRGTFSNQTTTSAKCLSARDEGLTVVIEHAAQTDGGGARIEGTVSGVAHVHEDLEDDATESQGDVYLDEAPFEGALSSGDVELDVLSLLAGSNPKHDVAGIEFDCAIQDLAEGTARLTLTFGQSDAPEAATAMLISTHQYQDYFLLLVPYQREARFVDHFSLVKE